MGSCHLPNVRNKGSFMRPERRHLTLEENNKEERNLHRRYQNDFLVLSVALLIFSNYWSMCSQSYLVFIFFFLCLLSFSLSLFTVSYLNHNLLLSLSLSLFLSLSLSLSLCFFLNFLLSLSLYYLNHNWSISFLSVFVISLPLFF